MDIQEMIEQLRLPGEPQFRAFWEHHNMGKVQNVADLFGVSYETVRGWKKMEGGWNSANKSVKILLWLCIQADRAEGGKIDPMELLRARCGGLREKG